MNRNKDDITLGGENSNDDQQVNILFDVNDQPNMSEKNQGHSKESYIDGIGWKRITIGQLQSSCMKEEVVSTFKIFDKKFKFTKNLAQAAYVKDDYAVDCSEFVVEKKVALVLFVDNCFNTEQGSCGSQN